MKNLTLTTPTTGFSLLTRRRKITVTVLDVLQKDKAHEVQIHGFFSAS
jgi:hypothetical protein